MRLVMDAAAEHHAMARALASLACGTRALFGDREVPLLDTAPAPVVRHRYRPPAPPRPAPIRDKIIAFVRTRPVAASPCAHAVRSYDDRPSWADTAARTGQAAGLCHLWPGSTMDRR